MQLHITAHHHLASSACAIAPIGRQPLDPNHLVTTAAETLMQEAMDVFGAGGMLDEAQFVLFARDLVKSGPGACPPPSCTVCDMRLQAMLLPSAVHQASANMSLHRGLLASK